MMFVGMYFCLYVYAPFFLFISRNIMGILNSTTDKKSTLNQCIIYYMRISRTYPKYLPHARPTQPKKQQSLALSRKKIEAERVNVKLAPDGTTNCTIICRRRQELRVGASKMAWLFKYILYPSYPILHDPSILLLSVAIL